MGSDTLSRSKVWEGIEVKGTQLLRTQPVLLSGGGEVTSQPGDSFLLFFS